MLHLIKKLFRYVYRSAISGKFVSKQYAEEHSDSTVREKL